jgi:hypothetical protein
VEYSDKYKEENICINRQYLKIDIFR